MIHVFALGFALGLFASAMPGPINVEVVRRTLSRGTRLGFSFGMGAVTADVFFAAAASLGALALLAALSDTGKAVLWFVGAVMLLLIGIRALRAKPAQTPGFSDNTTAIESIPIQPTYNTNVVRAYFVGLSLTLANPGTMFYWVLTSFGSARIAAEHMANPAPALAAGVAAACTLWVLMACHVAGKLHRRVQPQTYIFVDRIAGILLCLFALYSFLKGLRLLPYF